MVKNLFNEVSSEPKTGANATYIPVLAEADPDWFGVSICTVDGQRFDIGNTDIDFSMQSCVKPLMYAVGVEDSSLAQVHEHGVSLCPYMALRAALPALCSAYSLGYPLVCPLLCTCGVDSTVGIEPSGLAFNEVSLNGTFIHTLSLLS